MPETTGQTAGPNLPLSRRTLLGGAAAGATLARFNIARAQDATIRIGFPVPLTGPYGAEAQDQQRCAQLAVDEFNASGGLKGRKAELLVRDDKLNPGEASTRTMELIEKDKINFLAGSLSASVQLAINNIAKQHHILYNSISQSDQIAALPDWSPITFHEALTPHMTAGAVGRYAFQKFGKKVVFLLADYAYGYEMVAGFKAIGQKFGIEVLAEIRAPLGTTDFSTILPRIAALKPDILALCNFGRDQQIAVRQATDFGLKRNTKIVIPVIPYTSRVAGGPQAYEGVIGGTSYYWQLEKTVPSARTFNAAYAKKYGGKMPSDYGALGYAGVRAILEGVLKAGSTETDAVVAAMSGMHYDFYKGPEWYRPCDHQAVQSVLIIQSKSKNMANAEDVFDILQVDPGNEEDLLSCKEEGHTS